MDAKGSTWVGGAVFAAVLLLAGGWQFAISPALARADDARSQTAVVQGRNTQLQTQLANLKKQYADLDAYKANLSKLEVEIPGSAQLADYLRQVSTLAAASKAFVVSVNPGVPVPFVPAGAASAPQPVPTAGATASPGTSGTTAPSGAAPAGFIAVPVEMTLLGTVQNVTHALAALQGSDQRLFLVTALTGTGTSAQEATGGRPATAKGDLELKVTGYIYVLKDPSATTGRGGAATPAPLPPGDGSGATLTGA